ncbi:hypothetical protein J3F83DRAFT_744748 [Trichoderma novae-zelandiae]
MSNLRKAKRCSTCAARRIACDRKSPSCSQCLLTGRACGGYHRQTIFVQGDVGGTEPRRRRAPATDDPQSSAPRVNNDTIIKPTAKEGKARRRRRTRGPAIKYQISQPNATFSTELDCLISLIIENFTPAEERSLVSAVDGTAACLDSRVCGAWVTLLPTILARSSAHSCVLRCAVKTLGYTILGKIPQALEEYGETLRLFASTLGIVGEGSFEEFLAVILCLNIAEVLLGTEHNGWSAHARGISKLVQDKGPDAFKDGVPHQLFTSFRVFMLLHAIQQRRETFLDEPAWKTAPFASEPKSVMQSLLDQISRLPSLLQRLDAISDANLENQKESVVALYKDLDAQMLRLEDWEANLKTSAMSRLLWWPVAPSPDTETAFPISYEFTNVLVANTITHYWGFLLVVQISIETLRAVSDKHGIDHSRIPKQSVTALSDRKLTLANDICQSVRYHLRPEMKLYGPAATLFPLNVALQVFRRENKTEETLWCEETVSRLGSMGMRLAFHIPPIGARMRRMSP